MPRAGAQELFLDGESMRKPCKSRPVAVLQLGFKIFCMGNAFQLPFMSLSIYVILFVYSVYHLYIVGWAPAYLLI